MELLYVPSPAVIVKWACQTVDPKEPDRSLDLLQLWLEGGCEFALPPLWSAEVGSLLARLDPQRAPELMEILLGFRFTEVPMTAELVRGAQQLMQQCGVDYYPALYHAVALQQGGTLITCDASYFRSARRAGGVLLLKDFSAA